MSIRLMKDIWRVKRGVFTSTEKGILVKMADWASDDGSSIYPSLSRISAETEFTERCIQKTIASLLKNGILELVKSSTARNPNSYKINVDFLKKLIEINEVGGEPHSPQGRTTFTSRVEPGSSQGRTTFTPESTNFEGRGEPHSPQGRTTFTSRGEPRSPNPLIEPLIEPSLFCENSENFRDPEVQGVSVSKNDSEKNHEEVVNNFAETLGNISQSDLEAGIQNTPPGGVDPIIEKKSSEGFLKEDFDFDHSDNSDSDPFHDPSGCSSKSDHVPEDLLDEDPGYEESGYDYSLEERDLEEGDRNELSNGLEADRIKASRGDSMHAQAPLKQPSETNTPKTGHFSASEGIPLQDIKDDQKTSVACLKTPVIDMSDGGGEGESKKGVSRKQQKKENRGTRIDETMTLDKSKLDIALNQGFHGSWVVSEFEEFVRYYANPNLASSKALHVNWEATWRNWCKNAIVYDRYEKKSKPHPTNTTPSFESSAASLPSPAMDSRLQDFVKKNPQVGANSNGWAFSACKVIDQGDTILIIAPTNLSCDKVGMYGQALSAYFGKRVEITMNTPPRPLIPQNNERKYVAVDYVVQENHPKETAPNSLLQDIEVPSRVDNFPYKSIGVVLQEAMQGGMR